MPLITKLVYARRRPFLRRAVRELLALYGVEFPPQADVGPGLVVEHRGFGLVVSGRARLGSNVRLYQGVTIGEADVLTGSPDLHGISIGNNVTIGAGAKVLGSTGILVVHEGCVIGANAVLTRSTTGPNETWAGIPARRISG